MRRGLSLTLRGIVETLSISVPTLVDAARGRLTAELCDERLTRWAHDLLEQARVQLHVSGLESLPHDEAFVVMSNHQSLYDVPVLFSSFPGRLRMVAKSELFRVPIWGQAMRVAEFVEVDRSDAGRAIRGLERAKAVLGRGVSVWIAPEGTRSRDGKLGPFKSGGFHLAIDTGARILPVALSGTPAILPAKGVWVRPGAQVSVHFGAPIDPVPFGKARRSELAETVRTAIASLLSKSFSPPL